MPHVRATSYERVITSVLGHQRRDAWFTFPQLARALGLHVSTVCDAYADAVAAGRIDDTKSKRRRNARLRGTQGTDGRTRGVLGDHPLIPAARKFLSEHARNGVSIGCCRLARHLGVTPQFANRLIRRLVGSKVYQRRSGARSAASVRILKITREAVRTGVSEVKTIREFAAMHGVKPQQVKYALRRLHWGWCSCPYQRTPKRKGRSECREAIDPELGL